MLSFREWLLEKQKEDDANDDEQNQKNNQDNSNKKDQEDSEEKDQDDETPEDKEQDDEDGEEQPQRVFPKIKKKSEKLRDPDKVIKQNDKEINDNKEDDCDEDEGSDGIVSDMPTGTTSADVATVDNKINLVSRSLHKRIKSKKVDNSMIPTR